MVGRIGTVALALVALATPALACPEPTHRWTVVRGDLVAGASCGTLVASTDASDTRFTIGGVYRHVSLARLALRDQVTVPYELSFDWQWLTPGRWGLEIHGLGVVVLLGIDSIGFYVDDAQLMGSTFEPFATWSPTGTRHITVRQTAHEIVVLVDGKPIVSLDHQVVGRHAVDAPAEGTVMLGLRGAPLERTKALVRAVEVRALVQR